MAISATLFHCGAGSLLLLGIGHTLSEFVMGARPSPPALAEAMETLKNTRVPMPGRQVPLADLLRGFSLMMGLLLIAIGALDYAIVRQGAVSSAVLSINVALSALGLALSVRFFFIVPIVLCAASLGCFVASWLL